MTLALGRSARGANAMPFRPDLEGLRGVAVALVVLFHARLLGASGGFIGVDAFYVLSGYLISGSLLGELAATGRLDLVAFCARRARRILPAATVGVVAILVAAALVVAPLDLPSVALDGTASALFVGNLAFAVRASDYFATQTPSPFLHYWSLGVEEQFYLLWPLVLLLAFRARSVRRAIMAIAIGSFALGVIVTAVAPAWAFYLLPTRAWQLAVGALVGIYGPALRARRPAVVDLAGWAGLALLVVGALTLDSNGYPGVAALVPTAGVAAVIATDARRGPARVLAVAPLRWLGRISYSLYLYHWPIITLALLVFGDVTDGVRWALVAASLVAAMASRALVEEPFLFGDRARRAVRRSLVLAGGNVALVVVMTLLIGMSSASSVERAEVLLAGPPLAAAVLAAPQVGPPGPAETDAPPPAAILPSAVPPPSVAPSPLREMRPSESRNETDGLNERGCGLSLAGSEPPRCEFGVAGATITVALVGDSHAAQWSPALEEIAQRQGWRILPFTKDSCIFVDTRIASLHLEREYTECARWRQRVVAILQEVRPDLTIVSSSRWVHPVDPRDANAGTQAAAMARLVGSLPGRIAILADTPTAKEDVPACLTRRDRTIETCATPRSFGLAAHLARDGRVAELTHATLIDASPWLCGPEVCPAVIDGIIVLRDDHHLTSTMARHLSPLLEPLLVEALGPPR